MAQSAMYAPPAGLDPAAGCADPGYADSHAECQGVAPCDFSGFCPSAGFCGFDILCNYGGDGGDGGGGGGGGGGSASSAPGAIGPSIGGTSGLPPAALPNGPLNGPFGPGIPCDFGFCGSIANPYTGQFGGAVNVTLPWWGINITVFAGIAIDLHGHIAVYHGYGGGLAAGTGASGGIQIGASNADTVCGLSGPFANASGTFGAEGAAGTADVFQGSVKTASGTTTVSGGTVTLGVGGGSSASVGATTTSVVPIGKYSCK